MDSMTDVKISCASASLRTFAKRSTLKTASPRVMNAMSAKRMLHVASPCGMRCRIFAMRASLCPNALKLSTMVRPTFLMRV
eukprot:1680634-Pleurochrysis_carterae.AAC.1